MGIHLYSPQWDALGNRQLDHELSSPIIGGRSFLPVSGPLREKFRARMNAQDATAEDTGKFFVGLVSDAVTEIKADTDRLTAETKAYRSLVAKDLRAAAERADAATITGTITEIEELIRQPETAGVRHARSMTEDLKDAIADYGSDVDFDMSPVNAALAAFDNAWAGRTKALDSLRGIVQEAQVLLNTARDPATIARIRAEGKEVSVRGIVASLAEEMHAARQEAATAVARIDGVLKTLEAVR
jgi:outer membrane murein-binding lipoprotein Lpp